VSQQLNQDFAAALPVMGWIDGVIIGIIIAGCLASLPLLNSLQPTNVLIYKENRVIATYPLNTDHTMTLSGTLGPVTIDIKNHSVAITASECPQHICQKAGAVRHPHSQIVCAPNHLLITITSADKDSIDGVAR